MDTIGSRLLRTRKARGLTQGDLAQALGISINNVSKWERGLAEPRKPEHIEKLAKLLGVSKVYLAFGEDYLETTEKSTADKLEMLSADYQELAEKFVNMLLEQQSKKNAEQTNGGKK